MNQPGVLLVLIIFVAAVSFVVASEQYKHGRMSSVTLTGLAETHLGDPDGTGLLRFSVDANQNRFCYELTVTNIGQPTAALIHFGKDKNDGPSVMTLQTPVQGFSNGCVSLEASQVADLRKNTSSFYVNIQTSEFPAGAIRGQLTAVR